MNAASNKEHAWHNRGLAVAIVGALGALMAFGTPTLGKTDKSEKGGSLAGTWSGGGWVSFASGNKERARCRAHYSPQGGNSYSLSATCATASGKASQQATVYQVAANRFRGSFYNSDYNVSGSIRVVLSGNSQSVTLSGDSGSASLSLSRR